jgi:hypothetical protein
MLRVEPCEVTAFVEDLDPYGRESTPPNTARHRIAARWRMLLNVKGCGWAARGARMVWTPPSEGSVTRL